MAIKCPECGAEMKPLATSVYCPNDCDRKVTEHIDPEKTEPLWPVKPGQLSLLSWDGKSTPVVAYDWYSWIDVATD